MHQRSNVNIETGNSRAVAHTQGSSSFVFAQETEFRDERPEAKEALSLSREIAQAKPKPNNTGLPDNLKSGIEHMSGFLMDDVKVHYNSSKPSQLNAHAYAQGTQIHLAPGQHQHLPHEAWHVAQQKQGRVKPTIEVNGASVNDDVGLESEADVMGTKALQMKAASTHPLSTSPLDGMPLRTMPVESADSKISKEKVGNVHQRSSSHNTIQMMVTVGGAASTPQALIKSLWADSQDTENGLVWHDVYRDAIFTFSENNKVLGLSGILPVRIKLA